jgi:serine/threonine protein kinase
MAQDPTPPLPEKIGDYLVHHKIGQGSMGHVYHVEKEGQIFALKILSEKLSSDEAMVERFKREIRQSVQLDHPHIVRCMGMGIHEGCYFYVMEYVEGQTLQKILMRQGAFPFPQAIEIITQIAEALKYASNLNIIHRDIKPENIMIDSHNQAKLFDLGLAKSLDSKNHITDLGTVVGTPHYMSPEQALGNEPLDLRSDIYSLGATFFHMLVGRTPFQGKNAVDILQNLLKKDIPDLQEINPKLPERLCRLVESTLAKNKLERPQSFEALIEQLKQLQSSVFVHLARKQEQEQREQESEELSGKQCDYQNPFVLSYREFSFCRYALSQQLLSTEQLRNTLEQLACYWQVGCKLELIDLLLQNETIPYNELRKHHSRWMIREIENTNSICLDLALQQEILTREQYVFAQKKFDPSQVLTSFLMQQNWVNEKQLMYLQGCVWQKRLKNFNTLFIKVAVEHKFISKPQYKKCMVMYENFIIMGSFREFNNILVEKGYLENIHVQCILRALQWNQLFGVPLEESLEKQRIYPQSP